MPASEFSVYILLCGDGSYYTGIASDVERRLQEHRSSPRGAKYLKGRGPLRLVYSEVVGGRATALRAEYRIKQLDRLQKEALIQRCLTLQEVVADQDSVSLTV